MGNGLATYYSNTRKFFILNPYDIPSFTNPKYISVTNKVIVQCWQMFHQGKITAVWKITRSGPVVSQRVCIRQPPGILPRCEVT